MLANLANEVNFKKVFTDTEVFCAFVKDVLGIDIEVDKIETEKILTPNVAAIKFRMDIFAESRDKRVAVEIQKIDYDYTYDRFSHYFFANLVAVQRSSHEYAFEQEVYLIVVVTSAYRISEQNGRPILDDVLVTDTNPRTLSGEMRDMHQHKMVLLNTFHANADTPEAILDWLTLIRESMYNPRDPHVNTSKAAIAKAVALADYDQFDGEELYESKIAEMRMAARAYYDNEARQKGRNEGLTEGRAEGKAEGIRAGEKLAKDAAITKALQRGKLSLTEIAEDFEVSAEYVQTIQANIAGK